MAKQKTNYLIYLGIAALIFVAGNAAKQTQAPPPKINTDRPPPNTIKPIHIGGGLSRTPVDLGRVIDGDTIEVEYHGEQEKVRLLNINTVERGEPGYDEATDALKKILAGQNISLEFEEKGVEMRDKDGRLLCYVFVDQQRRRINANIEMVRLGHSKFWVKYGEGRYADEFRAAEKEAMQQAMDRGVMFDGIKPQLKETTPPMLKSKFGPANGVTTPREPQQKEKE